LSKTERIYILDPRLKEQLLASFKIVLDAHSQEWLNQIEAGEIDEETCTVLGSMKQIASKRDARLTVKPIDRPSPKKLTSLEDAI